MKKLQLLFFPQYFDTILYVLIEKFHYRFSVTGEIRPPASQRANHQSDNNHFIEN